MPFLDCTKARPHCKILEYGGSPAVCRCKSGSCIGDQTASSPQRHTVMQEPSGYQRCLGIICFILSFNTFLFVFSSQVAATSILMPYGVTVLIQIDILILVYLGMKEFYIRPFPAKVNSNNYQDLVKNYFLFLHQLFNHIALIGDQKSSLLRTIIMLIASNARVGFTLMKVYARTALRPTTLALNVIFQPHLRLFVQLAPDQD